MKSQTLLFIFAKERHEFADQVNKNEISNNQYLTGIRKIPKYDEALSKYEKLNNAKDSISDDCIISSDQDFFFKVRFAGEKN